MGLNGLGNILPYVFQSSALRIAAWQTRNFRPKTTIFFVENHFEPHKRSRYRDLFSSFLLPRRRLGGLLNNEPARVGCQYKD